MAQNPEPAEAHQPTVEELKAKAYQPMEDAMKLHPFYRGKIETTLKCCIRDFQDFGIWYTPGVSKPCLDIKDDPEKVYEHTNKWNTVAVISDGTRVLGMGDIGPKAGMPVMEGKSLLYKYLGGVDGFPLMVDTKDPDKFIEFVKLVQPGLGGVNLEDIAQPKCFRILALVWITPRPVVAPRRRVFQSFRSGISACRNRGRPSPRRCPASACRPGVHGPASRALHHRRSRSRGRSSVSRRRQSSQPPVR